MANVSGAVAGPLFVNPNAAAADSLLHEVPGAAKLFVAGTMLFGLAAAVRKAM